MFPLKFCFFSSFILFFKQSTIAEKLESGIETVLKNRHLLSKPDLSDVDLRRTELNTTREIEIIGIWFKVCFIFSVT